MKILVTGGIGRIGRVTVKQLIEHKHDVIAVDRLAEDELDQNTRDDIEGARYAQVDITSYDSLRPHFEDMEAVIHLAAFAHPSMGSGQVIFNNNAGGAFNVYQAAADAGIKRVVSASSINALGFNFGVKPSTIQYFPIDEEHPDVTTDVYSFGKKVLEEIADYFWRRDGISGVCLRFPHVMVEDQRPREGDERAKHFAAFRERMQAYGERTRTDFDVLLAMPDAERRAHMLRLVADYDLEREKRLQEIPFDVRRGFGGHRPPVDELPLGATLIQRRTNFWTILDARDAAQSMEKGVLADYEGSHPLYVTVAQNTLGLPSAQIAAIAFPEVTEYKKPLVGTESLVSIEKARALIGFEPEYMPTHTF